MTARNLLSYSLLFVAFVMAISCQELQVDAVGESYLDLPTARYEYNSFLDSSDAKPTLGRVLFYDRNMSLNNSVSCASCHKQSAGFADNVKFSRGFEGRTTLRNSMPIQNLATIGFIDFAASSSSFAPSSSSFLNGGSHFFWDGREGSLQNLILQPVGNHIEMGITDIDGLVAKLSAQPYYAPLFTDAFGSPEITHERISEAITTFISSINTNNTKFDRYNFSRFQVNAPGEQKANAEFSALEIEGMLLFQGKYDCNSCHQVTMPNGYIFAGTFANIGLDATYEDSGLAKVTGQASDVGKFKIPSLRNVAYTAPYMHDGRFESLEEVVDHYSEGLVDHPNLDPKLQGPNGRARSMNISEHEKQAIVAFLRTLSDESVIVDPKFSNPFKVK